jgi:hypothetical protein
MNVTPSVAQSRPRSNFAPSVAQSRPHRNAPSVAFGGHPMNNNQNAGINGRGTRSFAATTSPTGRSNMAFGPSADVSRGWDRGHVHSWNHHHYRWNNGAWVIIDGGFYGSPYGYYDDSDQPDVTYSNSGYYDNAPATDTLAASVQDQLTRLGYSPGPVDGVFGPQTQDAIMDFQNDHHLPVTGQIDGPLMRALGL